MAGRAREANLDMRLANLETSLRKMTNHCTKRVPIYIHPHLYKAMKIRFLLDIGKSPLFLALVNLHVVSKLTLEDFSTIVNTGEVSEEWFV